MKEEKLEILQEFINKLKRFKVKGYDNNHKYIKDFIKDFHTGEISHLENEFEDGEIMIRGELRSVIDTIIACQVHHGWKLSDILDTFKEAFKNNTLVGHYCGDIDRMILRIEWKAWQLLDTNELLDINLEGIYFLDILE